MAANITIIGRVGKDPEGNDKHQRFSVAVSQQGKSGQPDRPPMWFNVVGFSRHINYITKAVKKGVAITVIGKLEMDASEDGAKQYYKIIADEITVHAPPATQEGTVPTRGPGPAAAPNPTLQEIADSDIPF